MPTFRPKMSRPELRRVRLAFLVSLGLLVVVRALFVFSLSDVFFTGEELEKGTAAKGMLDGLGVAHEKLSYHYYEGGGFVKSHLTAVAFTLFGQNWLAHKVVALGFLACILLAGFELLRRQFGLRCAAAFGLLFAFGPESFQKLGMISLGIHVQGTLFLVLAFGLTMSILWRGRQGWPVFFALGVASGFGCYFSYQLVPAVAWCGLVLLFKVPKRVLGTGGVAGLAGFALGALPLWWMMSRVGQDVFFIHGTWLWDQGSHGGTPNSFQLREFLLSLYVDRSALDLLGPVLWPVAFLCAALRVIFVTGREAKKRRGPALFLILFVPFWLFVYVTSGFVHGEVYHFYLLNRFAPLWIVALLVIAIGIAHYLRSEEPASRGFGVTCALLLTALGALGASNTVFTGRPLALRENNSTLWAMKGYVYAPYFAKFIPHLEGETRDKLDVLLRYDEPHTEYLYPAISEELFKQSDQPLEALYQEFERADAANAADFAKGLGPLIHHRTGGDLKAALRATLGAPDRYASALREGIGRFGSDYRLTRADLEFEVQAGLGEEGASDYFHGLGDRIWRLWPRRPDLAREFILAQPQESRGALERGLQEAVRRRRLP